MTHRGPLENRCGSPANKTARTSEDQRCKLTISDRCVSRWIYTITGYDYMQSCTNEKRKKCGQSLWTLKINHKGGKSRMERPARKKDRVAGDIFVMMEICIRALMGEDETRRECQVWENGRCLSFGLQNRAWGHKSRNVGIFQKPARTGISGNIAVLLTAWVLFCFVSFLFRF